ncbi:MAG: hypothetical protein ACPGR5_07130, partial [Chitinophagales bacterium]
KNNRNLLRKKGLPDTKRTKRIYKAKTKNPHIKNMSKKELKAYRKELQQKASQRMIRFWLGIFGLFLIMFFYFLFKS